MKKYEFTGIYVLINLLLFFIIAIFSFFKGNMVDGATALAAMILVCLPLILKKKIRLHLPYLLEWGYLIFITSSIMFGSLLDFYTRFGWWDIYLHTYSGVYIGLLGFYLINHLNKQQVSMLTQHLFSFSLALAGGVLWEIYEFTCDQLFGMSLQLNSLMDTMSDLIVATAGAFGALIIYYLLVKYHKTKLVNG